MSSSSTGAMFPRLQLTREVCALEMPIGRLRCSTDMSIALAKTPSLAHVIDLQTGIVKKSIECSNADLGSLFAHSTKEEVVAEESPDGVKLASTNLLMLPSLLRVAKDRALIAMANTTELILWSPLDSTENYRFSGLHTVVRDLEFDPIGPLIAFAYMTSVFVLDPTKNTQRELLGPEWKVECVRFLWGGGNSYIAGCGDDEYIYLWNYQGDAPPRRLKTSDDSTTTCMCMCENNRLLAAVTDCGRILLWNISTGELCAEQSTDNKFVSIETDGERRLICATEGGKLLEYCITG